MVNVKVPVLEVFLNSTFPPVEGAKVIGTLELLPSPTCNIVKGSVVPIPTFPEALTNNLSSPTKKSFVAPDADTINEPVILASPTYGKAVAAPGDIKDRWSAMHTISSICVRVRQRVLLPSCTCRRIVCLLVRKCQNFRPIRLSASTELQAAGEKREHLSGIRSLAICGM